MFLVAATAVAGRRHRDNNYTVKLTRHAFAVQASFRHLKVKSDSIQRHCSEIHCMHQSHADDRFGREMSKHTPTNRVRIRAEEYSHSQRLLHRVRIVDEFVR